MAAPSACTKACNMPGDEHCLGGMWQHCGSYGAPSRTTARYHQSPRCDSWGVPAMYAIRSSVAGILNCMGVATRDKPIAVTIVQTSRPHRAWGRVKPWLAVPLAMQPEIHGSVGYEIFTIGKDQAGTSSVTADRGGARMAGNGAKTNPPAVGGLFSIRCAGATLASFSLLSLSWSP